MTKRDSPTQSSQSSQSPQSSQSSQSQFQVPTEFTKEDSKCGAFLEESTFVILYPGYREKYLKKVWPHVERTLEKYHIKGMLDLINQNMSVTTTRETWDPFQIINARDFINLLARSVPYEQAKRIFQNDVFCDIINIGIMVKNTERFIKRRQLILGKNGATLKAIEILTDCYVMIHGNTVSVLGSNQGIKNVRRIVIDCMKNKYHPCYSIERLMLQKQLAKNPQLADKSWDRLLPKFKRVRTKRQKPKRSIRKNKDEDDSPFPNAPTPRQEDLEMWAGEAFLSEKQKKIKKKQLGLKKSNQSKKSSQRKADREKQYQAPVEEFSDSSEDETTDSGDSLPNQISNPPVLVNPPAKRIRR